MINILLVDDKPANLLALAALLDRPDYHLVLAHSGKEAVDAVRDREFAVVLLDVQMPVMDGFETARAIRSIPYSKETPIIFVTANYRETKFVQGGYAAGGVDYLFKPLDADIVRSKVSIFVELFQKNKNLRIQQERTARLVAVQKITTEVLSKSLKSDLAIPDVLREVCKTLDWDMGTYWDLNREKNILKCKYFWSDPSCPTSFVSGIVKEGFGPGVGLPGRVWLSGRALWSKEGLGSAVAFPIQIEGRPIGVMEFFSREPQMEDLDLLKIVTAVGLQIGQFVAKMDALTMAQEAIRARDEFISIASHELKTPLTVLRLQTQMHRARLDKSDMSFFSHESLDRFVKMSVDQVERMVSLVENMLDVSRITHGQLRIEYEEFDLGEMVRQVVDDLNASAEAKGSKLLVDVKQGIIGEWDRMRLQQVMTNLISNAINYGGREPIEIGMIGDTENVSVYVKDHGPGIPAEDLERIFRRFERASGQHSATGLGLGLYISHQIIKAHEGNLKVTSECGKGSTFTIELPIRRILRNTEAVKRR